MRYAIAVLLLAGCVKSKETKHPDGRVDKTFCFIACFPEKP